MMETVTVEMPIPYLLQIAVAGKMGDGELLDLMKIWAQRECTKNGLEQNMHNLMGKRLNEMRRRLKNTIGDDLVTVIDTAITGVVSKLTG